MEEFVKEFKKDLIIYRPEYWTAERKELESNYRCEHLTCERGKIVYDCSCTSEIGTYSAAGIISETVEDFLRLPIRDIVNKCNAIWYYNAVREEEI